MNRLEGWLVHVILSYLPPRDLLAVADTCKWLRAYAFAERAWIFDRTRVLDRCPELIELFEPPGDVNAKRTNGELFPPGSWRTFSRYLCRDELDLNKEPIQIAVCRMTFPVLAKELRQTSSGFAIDTPIMLEGTSRLVLSIRSTGLGYLPGCYLSIQFQPIPGSFVYRPFRQCNGTVTHRRLFALKQFINRQLIYTDWRFSDPRVAAEYDALCKGQGPSTIVPAPIGSQRH